MAAFFLGVRVDTETRKNLLNQVKIFLKCKEQKMIFTPNPEMIVLAHKDNYFRNVLNKGSINICDGFGIRLVSWFRSKKEQPKRIPGIDFLEAICSIAIKENKSIYLIGSGKTGGPIAAAHTLQKLFPGLQILGIDSGPNIQYRVGTQIFVEEDKKAIIKIRKVAPDILFVGFGHGKQEEWIEKNLQLMPSVKIAMGVGGSFDFLSGKTHRAPKILRSIGLEWLWRLIHEPRRWQRIWTAVVLFPFLICLDSYYAQHTN